MTNPIKSSVIASAPESFIIRNAVTTAVSDAFGVSSVHMITKIHTVINVDGEYYTFHYRPELGLSVSPMHPEWNGRWRIEVETVYGGTVIKRPTAVTLRKALAEIVEAVMEDAAMAKAFAAGTRPRLVVDNTQNGD